MLSITPPPPDPPAVAGVRAADPLPQAARPLSAPISPPEQPVDPPPDPDAKAWYAPILDEPIPDTEPEDP